MTKARGLADLGNVYNDGALSNRNLIINGAMQVAQRGTSFTNTTGFQLDRWFVANPGTNTVSQVFDTTLNMYCLSVTQSAGYGGIYRVEDKDVKHLKAGDVVTLSYWVNVTSDNFRISTTATSQVSVSTTTIDTATGWYRRSASYTLTSAEVAAITGGSYLQINIEPSATSYKLTGVQLEVGDTATPFEHRSYGDELARCQRYYFTTWPSGTAIGTNITSTGDYGVVMAPTTNKLVYGGIGLPCEMRARPSVTTRSPTGTAAKYWQRYNATDFTFNYSGIYKGTSYVALTEYDGSALADREGYTHIFCDAEI